MKKQRLTPKAGDEKVTKPLTAKPVTTNPISKETEIANTETTNPIIAAPENVTAIIEPVTVSISGKLTKSDGTPASNAVVKVFNKMLRSEAQLGETLTDSSGNYEISFSTSGAPDITVKAFDKDQKEIAIAGPFFKVPQKKTVDLVVDNKPYKGQTEHAQLTAKATDKSEGIKLSELVPDELSLLSGKTGISSKKLTALSNAELLSDKHGISKDFLYGLINSDFKADIYSLAIQPDKIISNTIKRAVDKNQIPETEADDTIIAENINKVRTAAAKETLAVTGLGTSMSSMLHCTPLNDILKEKYLVTLYKNSNNASKTFEELKNEPYFNAPGLLDQVKKVFEIGSLTLNYAGMVRAINGKLSDTTPLSSFSLYTKDDWKKFIPENHTSVPEIIEGDSWAERGDKYAEVIMRNFEKAFPGEKVKGKLLADNPNDDIKKFFDNAADFDIGKTNTYSYLKKNETSLKGKVSDLDAVGKELKSWQRLYRVVPEEDKYEKMVVLKNAKLDSAFKITKHSSKDDFVEEFKDLVGGEAVAIEMFENAQSIASTAGLLYANIANVYSSALPAAIEVPDAIPQNSKWYNVDDVDSGSGNTTEDLIEIPDLATLFGNQSYCSCEHCRSVLSPAAYLVDLLELLRLNNSEESTKETPLDKLLKRRSDIDDIKLSCENTNTALPYIDLVNEILEMEVLKINETNVDYEKRQTTLTTQELQAMPEYISPAAYIHTAGAIYPFNLPFQMWNAEGEIYSQKLGYERHELARTLLYAPTNEDLLGIACIHLHLSSKEKDIIIALTEFDLKDFWGNDSGSWSGYGDVQNFLDKTKLTYQELLQLIQVDFIRYGQTIVIKFADGDYECDISEAKIQFYDSGIYSNVGDKFFGRTHRFLRLLRKTGWKILELDKAIQVITTGEWDENFIRQFSHLKFLKDELNIKNISQLISFWSTINTDTDESDEDSRSFYETLFLSKALSLPEEVVTNFALSEDKTALATEVTAPVNLDAENAYDYNAYIAGALNISSSDLELLKDKLIRTYITIDTTETWLTLQNLSVLYRHAFAAKVFRIKIDEFLILKEILPVNIFDATDFTYAVKFYDYLKDIKESEFSIKELNYLFRHQFETSESVAPSDTEIEKLLSTLHDGFIKIAGENNYTIDPSTGQFTGSDPTGEATKIKLAILIPEPDCSEANSIFQSEDVLAGEVLDDLIEYLYFLDPNTVKLKLQEVESANYKNADGIENTQTRIQARYSCIYILLMPYYVKIKRIEFAAQTIATAFNSDLNTTSQLLTNCVKYKSGASTVLASELLLDNKFTGDSESMIEEEALITAFTDQYKIILLLQKAATVLSKMAFKNDDAIWIYNNVGFTTWLDLNNLPLSKLEDSEDGTTNFVPWQLMYHFSVFNEKYRTTDLNPVTLLDMAIHPENYKPDSATDFTVELLKEKIAEYTGWDLKQVNYSVSKGYGWAHLEMFMNGNCFYQLQRCQNILDEAGATSKNLFEWIVTDLSSNKSSEIVQTVKAKYSYEQWLSIAPPLRDGLRKQQRDALTAYLIANKKDQDDNQKFVDETDMLNHYLIDVQMEPGMLSSRIKQACSSVQMFIQRSLMGLEDGVTINDENKELWEWMKYYRVWEANRKVFIFPENFLEPELRMNKSEIFEELQNELLQNEINTDNVETAFKHFVEKLHVVSHIQILETFHQYDTDDDSGETKDIFHVVGRTKSYPYVFYYRKLENDAWSAWEKIDLDIEGDFAIPYVVDGRLFLFWPEFSEETMASNDLKDFIHAQDGYLKAKAQELADLYEKTIYEYIEDKMSESFTFFKLKMSYSEYKSNKWQAKKFSERSIYSERNNLVLYYLALNQVYPINKDAFWFFPEQSSTGVKINVYQRLVFTSVGVGDIIAIGSCDHRYNLGYFNIDLSTNNLNANRNDDMYVSDEEYRPKDELDVSFPSDSYLYYNSFQEIAETTSEILTLPVLVPISPGSLATEPTKVLDLTDGIFNIPIPFKDDIIYFKDYFFYQDDNRCFLVKYVTVEKEQKAVDASSPQVEYQFINYYNPYSLLYLRKINLGGIDSLLKRNLQLREETYFKTTYKPDETVVQSPYPKKDTDFTYGYPNTLSNYELFFHAPVLIANQFSQNQKFEEAMQWYHYIFNPTDRSKDESTPQRYWQTKPFYEQMALSSIYDLLYALSYEGSDPGINTAKENVMAQIEAWKANPFEPHVVAELRIVAYMKYVVMKYLDNIIAWGDDSFRRDTMESINEAMQYYIIAYQILGKRPEEIKKEDVEPKTYNELFGKWDEFSNSLVELEPYVPTGSKTTITPTVLYFCIPNNDKLLTYWDTVEDRLFKIRNSMNIEGVKRQLALFEPPIDPMMLIKARAAGVDLSSVLSDLNSPLPNYRFRFYIQKAIQYCNDVQSMGSALLSALEKKDAEELSLMRATHELKLLQANREFKKLQIDEAKENLESIKRSKEITKERYQFYKEVERISKREQASLDLSNAANIARAIAAGFMVTSAALSTIPAVTVVAGVPPAIQTKIIDGVSLAQVLSLTGDSINIGATILSAISANNSAIASYDRRWDDWKLQEKLADKELKQIEKQIAAADIRVDIAKKDLKNLELQMDQSKQAYEFMKSKFTNKELYVWMSSEISRLYFQSYKLAYDCAKRAQRAFQYELGTEQTFLAYGNWDSQKKGLLAGEKLLYDLKSMEMSYYEQNKRGYELTKNISLAQFAPEAILSLRTNGDCFIDIPEALFDMDYPGHYMRRIKSVSLSIPCIAGPYTTIACTLTMVSNKYRKSTSTDDGYAETTDDTETATRFDYNKTAIQSIATGTGQRDSGLFQLNFEDERYIPFEGAGAISSWRIQLPNEIRQFDYNTISDIIMHISYTAKEGGETLKSEAIGELQTLINDMITYEGSKGLYKLFSLKHDFPSDFYKMQNTQVPEGLTTASYPLTVGSSMFPFFARSIDIQIEDTGISFYGADGWLIDANAAPIALESNSYNVSKDEWILTFEIIPDSLPDDVLVLINYKLA